MFHEYLRIMAVLFLATQIAVGQAGSADLTGVVSDSGAALLPGAKITALDALPGASTRPSWLCSITIRSRRRRERPTISQLQRLRRVRSAAAQCCGLAESAVGPARANALVQHQRLSGCPTVYAGQFIAESGTRSRLQGHGHCLHQAHAAAGTT